jgi:ankyrin repeat protein
MKRDAITSTGSLVAVLVVGMAAVLNGDSTPALVAAAQQQQFETVTALLKQGADPNVRRADGATALMWAAHWNHADAVNRLLRAGAKPNAGDDQGVTPLLLACENGGGDVVARLLEAGADPNLAQANGVTPLMMASRAGNPGVVQRLLKSGAKPNAAVPSTGQTALMWATAERHPAIMQALVAAGADVRARSTIGFTPLLFAVRNGDLDGAKILVTGGAEINEPGSDGTQALPLAIVSGRDAMASFLLDAGADPNSSMYGVSALHAAAGDVDTWLRDWLRARGASIYARNTSGLGLSARLALVKALIERGADVNGRTQTATVMGLGVSGRHGAFDTFSVGTGNLKGATPLWVAAFAANGSGSPRGGTGTSAADIVRVLLDNGANPNIPTEDGTTPLMVASGLGRANYIPDAKRGAPSASAESAVAMMLDAGAAIEAVNEAGFTALHGAAFRGLNEVITYLVKRGANINAIDYRGRTPYRIAEGAQQSFRIQSWPETAQLLQQLGADVSLGVDGRTLDREQARRAGETVR